MYTGLFLVFFLFSFGDCSKSTPEIVDLFNFPPVATAVQPVIRETSGIAFSKTNSGYLWIQEDSGNPPQLYLVRKDGIVQKKVYLKDAFNRDWEDMVLSGNDLYIGDIGDNSQVYPNYSIYKFAEPLLATDTVTSFDRIRFKYPDGSHDAEAFLVDPASKDIYIITKRDDSSKIYKLAYPNNLAMVTTATLEGTLPYTGVVSAALSPDASEIIIKTYTSLHHYRRRSGESIAQALLKKFTQLPYLLERQGEAVGFAADNSGFYTLSEAGNSSNLNLYFYKRK